MFLKYKKLLYRIGVFISVFLILFLLQNKFNISQNQYYFDCAAYSTYGNELFSSGKFDLLTLTTGFRGYVFPSILGICNHIGLGMTTPTLPFRILTSIVYAFLLSIVIPGIFSIVCKNKDKISKCQALRIFSLTILTLFFFYGIIIYPLTDMMAATFCLTAVWLILVLFNSKKNILCNLALAFLSGSTLYLCYNIRTIYMFSIYICIVIFVIKYLKKWKELSIYLLCFVIGLFFAAVPQIIINNNLMNSFSIMVPTENLMAKQLFWGYSYQRYETFVGTDYSSACMVFVDKTGLEIIAREGLEQTTFTMSKFFKLFFKYPFEYIGIYTRHFINMWLPVFPEQYVGSINTSRYLWVIVNYLLLFVGFIQIKVILLKTKLENAKTRVFTKESFVNLLVISISILPCLFILPGAIEQRFFISIYLLIFGFIVFRLNIIEVIKEIKKHKMGYLIGFIAVFAVLLSVWTNALSSLELHSMLLK